jgi:membrane-associated protein
VEFVQHLIDLFLHLDRHLGAIIEQYGTYTYLILFVVIFCETGLVFTPFLPGDSLLFAAGTFGGMGKLDVGTLFLLLAAAAIIGDNSNYAIGRYFGSRILRAQDTRWLKKEHIERTHGFFERYGTKAIIMARFVPIIRTFTPFVAGLGRMTYRRFLPYDIGGGILWVGTCVFAGYFFGGRKVVQENFSLVILAIIVISVIPAVVTFIRAKRQAGPSQTARKEPFAAVLSDAQRAAAVSTGEPPLTAAVKDRPVPQGSIGKVPGLPPQGESQHGD